MTMRGEIDPDDPDEVAEGQEFIEFIFICIIFQQQLITITYSHLYIRIKQAAGLSAQ